MKASPFSVEFFIAAELNSVSRRYAKLNCAYMDGCTTSSNNNILHVFTAFHLKDYRAFYKQLTNQQTWSKNSNRIVFIWKMQSPQDLNCSMRMHWLSKLSKEVRQASWKPGFLSTSPALWDPWVPRFFRSHNSPAAPAGYPRLYSLKASPLPDHLAYSVAWLLSSLALCA